MDVVFLQKGLKSGLAGECGSHIARFVAGLRTFPLYFDRAPDAECGDGQQGIAEIGGNVHFIERIAFFAIGGLDVFGFGKPPKQVVGCLGLIFRTRIVAGCLNAIMIATLGAEEEQGKRKNARQAHGSAEKGFHVSSGLLKKLVF